MTHFAAFRPETSTETEKKLNIQIEAEWEREAQAAHKEEFRIALGKGQTYQGKPWIKVAVDGGWQKMSHGHSYSSTSGNKINQTYLISS